MTITRVKLENFTVFESLDLEPSPGINMLVGANGTGKTHLMKVCYAACSLVPLPPEPMTRKLLRVFLPSANSHERLVKHGGDGEAASVEVFRGKFFRKCTLPKTSRNAAKPTFESTIDWPNNYEIDVYIPAKDMLANAPGFRSLYAAREVHFEEIYQDILDRAYLPPLRNPAEFVPANVICPVGSRAWRESRHSRGGVLSER